MQRVTRIQPYLSRATGFTVDPSLRIPFSRLIVQGRPRGVKDIEADMRINTKGTSGMSTDSIATINVECLLLPQERGRTFLDGKRTDASSVLGEGSQSTPGNQALMRDPSSFKVWSTEIELTEKTVTEARRPAAEFTSQVPSVSAEQSELQ